MAKKKGKKNKKGKKKKTTPAADAADAADGAASAAQPLPGMPTHWPEPECLPTRLDVPSCTCFTALVRAKGNYVAGACALHAKFLSSWEGGRLSPRATAIAASHELERQTLRRVRPGVRAAQTCRQTDRQPASEIEFQLDNYTRLLANQHGQALSDPDRAEVLVRQATLMQALGQDDAALAAAETAIGLRPTLAQSYYIAGQSYFRKQQFASAVERFREGLREAPSRVELQQAFRVALLEANKHDS